MSFWILKPEMSQFIAPFTEAGRLAINLAIFGWHRWQIAMSSFFLAQVCNLATSRDPARDALSLAIIGSLAAFTGQQLNVSDKDQNTSTLLEDILRSVLTRRNMISAPVVTPDRLLLAEDIVRHEKRDLPEVMLLEWLYETQMGSNLTPDTESREFFPKFFFISQVNEDLLAVLLFHLGPDPLETLCRRLVGLPDSSGYAR